MDLTFYLDDDTTPATSRTFSADAGDLSSTETWHLWANKGTPSGTAPGVAIRVEVWDTGTSRWLTTGVPALDDAWFRVRVVGSANPSAHAEFAPAGTAWTSIGAGRQLRLVPMLGNTSLYVEVAIRPPLRTGAASETVTCRLVPSYNNTTFPLPNGVAEQGVGILTSVGDAATSELLERLTVTPTGTPDDYVHVPAVQYLFYGVRYNRIGDDVQLNQDDGDSATLGSGEEYLALLYQKEDTATTTVLKGSKATAGSAVAPTLGVDQGIPLALVTVAYDAGGGAIDAGAITQLSRGSRFQPIDDGGLNVTIEPGEAILGSCLYWSDSEAIVPLNASQTQRVWVTPTGFEVVSGAGRPERGAVLVCEAVTDGTGITTLTDLREYREPGCEVLHLATAGVESTGTDLDRVMVPYRHTIDRVVFWLEEASAGATGSTIVDLTRGSGGSHATIFTNQGGSPETRPEIAAGGLGPAYGMPEVTLGEAGDYYELDVDAITSGGTQGRGVAVALYVYRRF